MRKQLITVSGLTVLAQAVGFLKMWLTARLFGVGAELDGYFLALVVPTLVSGILSGALQTALFPVRARLAAASSQDVVERFERTVLLELAVFGSAIAALSMLLSPVVLAGEHITPATQTAFSFVLPFAALLIPLNAVGDGLGYLLAMRNRYPVAAAAPIANALLGAGLLAVWPQGGLLNLALGTVLGLVLQLALCVVGLKRTGFALFGARALIEERRKEWLDMARLGAWILPGVAFSNVTISLPPVLLARYGEGAISAFSYAWRFHASAIQLTVMAISPVLLARFAELIAHRQYVIISRLLRKGAWGSLAIGMATTLCVWAFGAPLLTLIFGGRFDAVATQRVAEHWFWLTLGFSPAIYGSALAKLWQANGSARLLSILAGAGLSIFVAGVWFVSERLGQQAVPFGLTISQACIAALLWVLWRLKTAAPIKEVAT